MLWHIAKCKLTSISNQQPIKLTAYVFTNGNLSTFLHEVLQRNSWKNQHHFVAKTYHGCYEFYMVVIFVMQAFVMQ